MARSSFALKMEHDEFEEVCKAFERACCVQAGERDAELFNRQFDESGQPTRSLTDSMVANAPEGWRVESGYPTRTIQVPIPDPTLRESPDESPAESTDESTDESPNVQFLTETILPFPSAPIHGIQRLHSFNRVSGRRSEVAHTYRVLTEPDRKIAPKRIFLLHNGLNETFNVRTYYRLAGYLIASNPDVACIIRPFPGHIWRFPYRRFAESPLDRYLWDGSHLFRQYLRFMAETRWFLSALVRRSRYRLPSGTSLVAENELRVMSRLDIEVLPGKIRDEYEAMHAISDEKLKQMEKDTESKLWRASASAISPVPDEEEFVAGVKAIRDRLHLSAAYSAEYSTDDKDDPEIHAIGYSLGGFAAQSVFMAWPWAIDSCTTLLSGGALRDLAPTEFAHPEEWQTVLHSLRYELDDAMMDGRFTHWKLERGEHKRDKDETAGMETELFLYFKRTFYEVFAQEYRGSFQSRASAFKNRLLFVVGGNDTIVRPQSVLDAAPSDGINMLSIGGLGHFFGEKTQADQESFWLPVVASLVGTFADRASQIEKRNRADSWLPRKMFLDDEDLDDALSEGLSPLSETDRLEIAGDGALPSRLFQRCLDDMLWRQTRDPKSSNAVDSNDSNDSTEDDHAGAPIQKRSSLVQASRKVKSRPTGALFVLRNEVPTMLLDGQSIMERAAVLNHDDSSIATFARSVLSRKKALNENSKHVYIVLPWNLRNVMQTMDAIPGHPSQGEGMQGQRRDDKLSSKQRWEICSTNFARIVEKHGEDAIRIFSGNMDPGRITDVENLEMLCASAEPVDIIPSMPDLWVWASSKFLLHDVENDGDWDEVEFKTIQGRLNRVVATLKQTREWDQWLRSDHLRVVQVSRARYNPRFRGRILATGNRVGVAMHHAALCLSTSAKFTVAGFDRHEWDNQEISGRSSPSPSRTR